MQKITTHLWYDKEAKQAVEFYVSVLGKESKLTSQTAIHNTPSGDVDIVNFNLLGEPFMAISAGPLFKFNPSVSFLVRFETAEEVERAFKLFSEQGQVLMPLGEYPFSKKYAWVSDKFGLSWQLMLGTEKKDGAKIVPMLLFVGDVAGKAETAMNFYTSVFRDSKAEVIQRHEGGTQEKVGTVKYGALTLEGKEFALMDSALQHKFAFNEAVSFIVNCADQKEIDYFWEKLSAHPENEQCGWLKDRFGLSWQIVPKNMKELMASNDQAKVDRVTKAFLKMKKFDIAALEKAALGNS